MRVPPTIEARDLQPSARDVKYIEGLRRRYSDNPEKRAHAINNYLKLMMSYGHRRWAILKSEGLWVLAVRNDVLYVVDFEEMPPPRILAICAWQQTTRGAHVYLPPQLVFAPEWKRAAMPYVESTKKARDRRYCALSMKRGYFHERPRRNLHIPPTIVAPTGYLETLELHRQWHEYAADYAAERGQ